MQKLTSQPPLPLITLALPISPNTKPLRHLCTIFAQPTIWNATPPKGVSETLGTFLDKRLGEVLHRRHASNGDKQDFVLCTSHDLAPLLQAILDLERGFDDVKEFKHLYKHWSKGLKGWGLNIDFLGQASLSFGLFDARVILQWPFLTREKHLRTAPSCRDDTCWPRCLGYMEMKFESRRLCEDPRIMTQP